MYYLTIGSMVQSNMWSPAENVLYYAVMIHAIMVPCGTDYGDTVCYMYLYHTMACITHQHILYYMQTERNIQCNT